MAVMRINTPWFSAPGSLEDLPNGEAFLAVVNDDLRDRQFTALVVADPETGDLVSADGGESTGRYYTDILYWMLLPVPPERHPLARS